jgi:chromosome segregation ATPase
MLNSRIAALRKLLSDRVGRIIDWRIVHPVEGNRLFELYGTVNAHERRLEEQRQRMDRIAEFERRFREVEKAQHWSANELERIIPQIAAQESQLESLREKLDAVPAADQPQIDESRSLLDEIRREHSQIRVRLTAVAQYEDRLRKLEDPTRGN